MTLEFGHEPLLGVLAAHALLVSEAGAGALALGDTEAGAAQHDVEVHSVDTDGRVVLQAEIDVLV